MKPRALIADDDHSIRALVKAALQSLDLSDVIEAGDGDEALLLFRHDEVDLVITDWRMPGRNGLELTESIRLLDANVPILMLTAVNQAPMMMEALKSGVSTYLMKPFTPDQLRTAVKSLIGTPH